jgi:DNA-binding LacI/PurR family transcriptional regulator/DNA-binding CsgD family transcriptional regulator
MNGIHESAYQKRWSVKTFFSPETLIKALEKEKLRYAIVISESNLRSENHLIALNKENIHPLFVNMQFQDIPHSFSTVITNYFSASYRLSRLLLNEFPESSAFVGFNPDSSSDKLRLGGFIKAVKEYEVQYSVYDNNGSVNLCINDIMKEIDSYKNIVCANDALAILLIMKMKEVGLRIGDFNITGYGNFRLGEYFNPSLTTTVSDYYGKGVLAVGAYTFLLKRKTVQNLSISAESKIIIRESTHLKNKGISVNQKFQSEGQMVKFYGDESVNMIDSVECMLTACDETDIKILHEILGNKTYEEISELNYLATNTIKYRIKKIENRLNVKNRIELIDRLKNFSLSI